MSSLALDRVRNLWRLFSTLDRFALGISVLYGLVWLARASGRQPPLLLSILIQYFFYFFILGYVLYRLISLYSSRLLWSLRNRLVVAYLFIAVVPVLLLLAMAGFSAELIYRQVGAYLLHDDLQVRIDRLRSITESVLATVRTTAGNGPAAASRKLESLPEVDSILATARAELPGLAVEYQKSSEVLRRSGGAGVDRFAGLVQSNDQLWLMAVAVRRSPERTIQVALSAPVDEEFLGRLVPGLGPVQVNVTRPAQDSDPPSAVQELGGLRFVFQRLINGKNQTLAAPANRLDSAITGIAKLEALRIDPGAPDSARSVVFASLASRPSLLNRQLFSRPGEAGSIYAQRLIFLGVLIFVVLEFAALITGVRLTRTITRAVDNLYSATQFIQSGDFTHRVRVQGRDQLGELGGSFNAMTGSISTLIDEQRQRQRLENELSIAHEVQAQLFPQKLPEIPGVELAAVCRAARVVSGDYYDFVQLGPHRIGMAVADISGKGISAALLMASLQAAFRSQLLLEGTQSEGTSELVTRLNLHLFRNTSDDRYATLFYAVYDSSTRQLRYTNAGHLPPLLVAGERAKKLDEGGMVVGLFDDCAYEQGCVTVEPGSLLVAYSDGITEPENVYGEQFGSRRLAAEVIRHRQSSASRLAEQLIAAAEEWGQSPEQADDMTVVIARLA